MPERFVFADEAGCFTFEKKQNVSRYFILCTVSMSECDAISADLARLRRKLVWDEKAELQEYFHATTDRQYVRDAVFDVILQHKFKVQATILEKSKAQPQVRVSKARFYKIPWFYHFKHGLGPHVKDGDSLLVTAASIGNRKERLTFLSAIDDVVGQTVKGGTYAVDFAPAATDKGLQVADYCAWAIQRKWETGGSRSYDLIADRMTYEYDLWEKGTDHYY